jgi:hypothetical protein
MLEPALTVVATTDSWGAGWPSAHGPMLVTRSESGRERLERQRTEGGVPVVHADAAHAGARGGQQAGELAAQASSQVGRGPALEGPAGLADQEPLVVGLA